MFSVPFAHSRFQPLVVVTDFHFPFLFFALLNLTFSVIFLPFSLPLLFLSLPSRSLFSSLPFFNSSSTKTWHPTYTLFRQTEEQKLLIPTPTLLFLLSLERYHSAGSEYRFFPGTLRFLEIFGESQLDVVRLRLCSVFFATNPSNNGDQ